MTGTNLDPSVTATDFFGNLTGNVTGNVTGNISGGITGAFSGSSAIVAAAGATQGTAALIGAVLMAIVTVTASTEGVRLPTAATNRMVFVTVPGTKGVKIYPFSGDQIDAAGTNASVALVAGKGNLYYAKNTSQWYTAIKGA